MDPGRPHSPTLNACRTRPEAEEFALKNKGTNDWFRHDGKNVEVSSPPPGRLSTNEAWYKHEDNKDFVSPRPKSRLVGNDAVDAKDKIMGRSGTEWYSHEHKGTNGYTPPKAKSRISSANAKENATKLRPTGPPVWASYDQNGGDVTDSPRPASRLTNQGAEYHERSKGSAGEWFGHAANGHSEVLSPRRGSQESQGNAQKHKGVSGNWFNHDANKNYIEPAKAARCRSASAREMIEKTRGHELSRVMHHENDENHNGFHDGRIKPEAAEYAQKSVHGMMSKYLDQDANKDYESARPGARVKPEGQDNMEKNKGVMGEFMEGYLDTPKKHDVRRVRPEAEEYANRNRGMAGRAITGDVPGSARKHPRIKGEAEKYAERNKGTKGLIGSFGGLEVTGTPIKHRSKEAAANAARWQGSEITGVFNHEN